MTEWATFWGWLLVCVLLIFTALAVTITIGGFFDIKALLTTLKHKDSPDESSDSECVDSLKQHAPFHNTEYPTTDNEED